MEDAAAGKAQMAAGARRTAVGVNRTVAADRQDSRTWHLCRMQIQPLRPMPIPRYWAVIPAPQARRMPLRLMEL